MLIGIRRILTLSIIKESDSLCRYLIRIDRIFVSGFLNIGILFIILLLFIILCILLIYDVRPINRKTNYDIVDTYFYVQYSDTLWNLWFIIISMNIIGLLIFINNWIRGSIYLIFGLIWYIMNIICIEISLIISLILILMINYLYTVLIITSIIYGLSKLILTIIDRIILILLKLK